MIEYTLQSNELTGDPAKLWANVVNSRNYTLEDIVKHIVQHNTGITRSDVYAVWEGLKDVLEEMISSGGSIRTELFNARISIKGTFNGHDDGFDESRHELRLNLQPGSFLRSIPQELRVKKVSSKERYKINSVTDNHTGLVNSSLTPGKTIRLIGHGLKISGDDPSCGFYIMPKKAQDKPIKIEASELVVNKPSEVIVAIPNLCKGAWTLKLITQYSGGTKCLKTPRCVPFENDLLVV